MKNAIKVFTLTALLLAAGTTAMGMSIFEAAKSGTVKDVQAALENGYDPNTIDGYGTTVLMEAALHNTPDVVKALINAGANIKAKNFEGTALHYAVSSKRSNSDVIKVLIDAGVDINAKDGYGRTALHVAVHSSTPDLDKIKTLVDAGINLNATTDSSNLLGETALIWAVFTDNPNIKIIQTLVDAGTNLEIKDKYGRTALDIALDKFVLNRKQPPSTNIIETLIKGGAYIDKNILLTSNRVENANVVRILIEAGASVTVTNKNGETPLLHTLSTKSYDDNVIKQRPDVIKTLIEAGADVNAKSNSGRTVLMEAACTSMDSAIIEILISAGADVNAKANDNTTALIEASKYKHSSFDSKNFNIVNHNMAKMLIKAGADIKARDIYGKTALIYAIDSFGYLGKDKPNPEIITTLIEAGADINDIDVNNLTKSIDQTFEIIKPLVRAGFDWSKISNLDKIFHRAVKYGNPATIKSLIEAGARATTDDLITAIENIEEPDVIKALIDAGAVANASVLMVAIECNSDAEVIKILVDAGANVNATHNKRTVLMWAVQKTTYPDVIKVLVEAGADIKVEYRTKIHGDTKDLRAIDYLDDNKALYKCPEYDELKALLKGRKTKEEKQKEKKSKKDKKK